MDKSLFEMRVVLFRCVYAQSTTFRRVPNINLGENRCDDQKYNANVAFRERRIRTSTH